MPSPTHRLLTRLIPLLRGSREVDDEAKVRREVLARQASSAADAPPARLVRGLDVIRLDLPADGGVPFPVFDLRVRGSGDTRTILYLHGGGFVGGIDRFHWKYVVALARATGSRVVVPAYPLTPLHTWRESHPPLLGLFQQLAIDSPGGVALVGDSAGGGLALALAQQIARRSGPQPTRLVLISPWVDLTGTTPGTEQLTGHDPWLKLSKLRLYGGWWAGADDARRPEVSPLNGDFAGLPPALVLCGTRDLLVPQVRETVLRARAAGVETTYVEEPGLLHVYPILPVPEARSALRTVADFLGTDPTG